MKHKFNIGQEVYLAGWVFNRPKIVKAKIGKIIIDEDGESYEYIFEEPNSDHSKLIRNNNVFTSLEEAKQFLLKEQAEDNKEIIDAIEKI